jgi:hypothetical protein
MSGWKTKPRAEVISTIQRLTNSTSKVLFGAENLLYGNLGGEHRHSYGVLFTQTPDLLSKLNEVPPGAAHEYRRGG